MNYSLFLWSDFVASVNYKLYSTLERFHFGSPLFLNTSQLRTSKFNNIICLYIGSNKTALFWALQRNRRCLCQSFFQLTNKIFEKQVNTCGRVCRSLLSIIILFSFDSTFPDDSTPTSRTKRVERLARQITSIHPTVFSFAHYIWPLWCWILDAHKPDKCFIDKYDFSSARDNSRHLRLFESLNSLAYS